MNGRCVIKQEKEVDAWIREKLGACLIGFIAGMLLTALICIRVFIGEAGSTDTKLRELGEELDRTSNSLSITTNRLEQAESVIERCQQSTSRITEIAGTSTDTLRGTINSLREIKQEVEYMEGQLHLYISNGSNSNDNNDSTVDKGEMINELH